MNQLIKNLDSEITDVNKKNRFINKIKEIVKIYDDYLLNWNYIYYTKKVNNRDNLSVYYKKKHLMHLLGIYSYDKVGTKFSERNWGSLAFYNDLLSDNFDLSKVYIEHELRTIKAKINSIYSNLRKIISENSRLQIAYNLPTKYLKNTDVIIQSNDLLLGIIKLSNNEGKPSTVRCLSEEKNNIIISCKKYQCKKIHKMTYLN